MRVMRYTETVGVYWRSSACRRPLRLITLCGLPYRGRNKQKRRRYREPIFLLTTDLDSPVADLIQAYLNRWEIEVNHRDLKNNLGLGEAQVWSERSVSRQPQLVALAYSTLLLASLAAYGPLRGADYHPPPKWYRGRLRPTIEDLKRVIRGEVCASPELQADLGMILGHEQLAIGCAA